MRDEPLHALALPLICAALLQHGGRDRRTFHLLPVSAARAVLPFGFVDADIVQNGCSFSTFCFCSSRPSLRPSRRLYAYTFIKC